MSIRNGMALKMSTKWRELARNAKAQLLILQKSLLSVMGAQNVPIVRLAKNGLETMAISALLPKL